ncbi:MAG: conserved rane protein of unknown function [Tardiphaga sp.]|nr:conserved rane protein of unknown function [Tardiphaga sp.]
MSIFPVQALPPMSRLRAALLAGTVAIILNTLALKAADLFELATAHGGLLRLLTSLLSGPLVRFGVSSLWSALHGPAPKSALFQTSFHLAVGITMALLYAFVLEPVLPQGATFKGWFYAIAVWIINAAIILPVTGEGFAGSANLTWEGIVWFADCHALFFLLLAYGYDWLRRPSPAGGSTDSRRHTQA